MKYSLFTFLMLLNSVTFSQISKLNDSLYNEICKTLIASKALTDSLRLEEINKKHISPVLNKVEASQQTAAVENISFRLQRICKEFKSILERIVPNKGDWETINEKPTSKLNKETCLDIFKTEKYYYLEASGDTARISIRDGFWQDNFKDGTYSKLKFYWISDCEFEIEFIESNNRIRKNLSKPGDKYRYLLLEKGTGYFKLSVEMVGTNQFATFKLYY